MHSLWVNLGVALVGVGTLIYVGALAFFALKGPTEPYDQAEEDRYWYGDDEYDG